jgi:hypothetical protein
VKATKSELMMTISPIALEGAGLIDQERGLYGAYHGSVMAPLHEALKGLTVQIAEQFCEVLSLGTSRQIIESLSDHDRKQFALEQALHLISVTDPQLTATLHQATARKAGRTCAILNVDFTDIIPAQGTLLDVFDKLCDQSESGAALSLIRKRLTLDQQLRADFENLLERLGTLAAETGSYNDLIAGTVELLRGNEELAGC